MLDFSRAVSRDGYAWWYVDGVSDDGRSGLVLIAFVGSVFSPYYAAARRRGAGHPEHHCAINVALYGAGGKRWAMTERGAQALHRTPHTFAVGQSELAWDGTALTATIREITVPWPGRLVGRLRLVPESWPERVVPLAPGHVWQPIAPRARIEVEFERPERRWSGHAYWDANRGEEPLERGFARWTWLRAALPGGDTAVLYDVVRRDGSTDALALRFGIGASVERIAAPPPMPMPRTLWGVDGVARSECAPRVAMPMEDAPFYSRRLIEARLGGAPVQAVHEALDLDRFARRWVQTLLPFRMPRRAA